MERVRQTFRHAQFEPHLMLKLIRCCKFVLTTESKSREFDGEYSTTDRLNSFVNISECSAPQLVAPSADLVYLDQE